MEKVRISRRKAAGVILLEWPTQNGASFNGEPIDGSGVIELTDKGLIETAGEDTALEFGYTAYRYEWNLDNTDIIDIIVGAMAKNYKISVGFCLINCFVISFNIQWILLILWAR